MVAQWFWVPQVAGSNPAALIENNVIKAQMAKLVDALGLGSNEYIHAGSSPVLRNCKNYIIFVHLLSLLYCKL